MLSVRNFTVSPAYPAVTYLLPFLSPQSSDSCRIFFWLRTDLWRLFIDLFPAPISLPAALRGALDCIRWSITRRRPRINEALPPPALV